MNIWFTKKLPILIPLPKYSLINPTGLRKPKPKNINDFLKIQFAPIWTSIILEEEWKYNDKQVSKYVKNICIIDFKATVFKNMGSERWVYWIIPTHFRSYALFVSNWNKQNKNTVKSKLMYLQLIYNRICIKVLWTASLMLGGSSCSTGGCAPGQRWGPACGFRCHSQG